MSMPSQQPIPPVVPIIDGEDDQVSRDEDGTPVGRDDLRADIERSGGDPAER